MPCKEGHGCPPCAKCGMDWHDINRKYYAHYTVILKDGKHVYFCPPCYKAIHSGYHSIESSTGKDNSFNISE